MSAAVGTQTGTRLQLVDSLANTLADWGVYQAFGILGGAVAPFCRALVGAGINATHFRHEAGAAFAATEASLASGRPVVVFTTSGPGVSNAITGMLAARSEGARVLLISGATPLLRTGAGAFQESDLLCDGDLRAQLASPAQLPALLTQLARGLARPHGFVAHLALPLDLQTESGARWSAAKVRRERRSSPRAVARLAEVVREPFYLWLGFGARKAASAIRQLAERTGCPVVSTPRGKGVFPESHPQFWGVTGLGGHDSAAQVVAQTGARRGLVLGTRLGEFSSFWDRRMLPPGGLVQVDIDPDRLGAAYAGHVELIEGDIEALIADLNERDLPRMAATPRPLQLLSTAAERESVAQRLHAKIRRASGTRSLHHLGVRPSALFAAVQRRVVDASDAIVLTEAGNAFAWGSHALAFDEPGRYRTSMAFGAMGHATTGVVGAALARNQRAVALIGDGAMLMSCELSTAAATQAPALWIVLNDARYGMIDEGMQALGWRPFATEIPRVDFAAMAATLGVPGERVHEESELDDAITRGMQASGPYVVDVTLSRTEPAPSGARNDSLKRDGAV